MASIDLTDRAASAEWMDDRSITDARLTEALHNIRMTNRWLGGYRASDTYLDPLLRRHSSLRVLDIGAGLGDYAAHLVRRGRAQGCRVSVTAVDNNPVTVGYARAWLDANVPSSLRSRVKVRIDDATTLSPDAYPADVVHASLFLHHFYDETLINVVATMQETARCGIVINDLHRHALAYAGIWMITRLFPVSPMYRHDAPLSVRRGFSREELRRYARRSGLSSASIRWHWAFRWVLTTLPVLSP